MKRIILLTSFIFACVIVGRAQISELPIDYSCDITFFEESFEAPGIPVGWTNLELDSAKLAVSNVGWVKDRDMTFTANTGPNAAQEGTFYVYCDGSSPIGRGDTATMLSPMIELSSGFRPGVTFYLNMYGRSGTFYVNVIESGNRTQVLPSVSGDVTDGIHAPDEWEQVFIDLNPYRNRVIQLEFVTIKPSSGFTGDVSIDNIVVCASANPIPTMSEWALLILFLMLLILGVIKLKSLANPSQIIPA